jgi:hypothetical protein
MGDREMRCIACGAEEILERPERTARGYRRLGATPVASSSMNEAAAF